MTLISTRPGCKSKTKKNNPPPYFFSPNQYSHQRDHIRVCRTKIGFDKSAVCSHLKAPVTQSYVDAKLKLVKGNRREVDGL